MKQMKTMICLVIGLSLLSAEGKAFYGRAGQQVKMQCGGSSNMDLDWTFDGQMIIRLKARSGKTQNGPAYKDRFRLKGNVMEISGLEAGDLGSYVCNVEGRVFGHRLYMVSVSASPSDPVHGADVELKCQVSGAEPLPSVRWIRPDGRPADIPDSGSFQVKQSDSGEWVCELSVDGQTHNETQTIDVKPGLSTLPPPAPGPHDKTHPGSKPPTHPPVQAVEGVTLLGLGLWMWVAVGGGCLVLVLLVVLVVLIHRRNKRMKRRVLKNIRKPLELNEYCQCKSRPASRSQRGPRGKPSPAARQQR